MNIPLNVLVDAEKALKMLRQMADAHSILDTAQWTQALSAHSMLEANLIAMTRQIKVEVES